MFCTGSNPKLPSSSKRRGQREEAGAGNAADLKTVVDLKRQNREETAFRLKMNDVDLVDGSNNTLTAPPK